jgi:hypothetical protein
MEGRTNSFVDSPPSATSPVSGQGQGDPKESPSYNKFTTHTTENGTPTTFLPHTYNNIQEASQIETALVNRHRSELTCPTKQAGTGCEIMHERMRISNDIEKLQSKTTRNLVQFPKSNKSREIFKAKELHEFQSRANTILKTNESESSPIIAVNPGEVGTTLNTKRSSVGTSVSHDPEQSAFKDQLIRELKQTGEQEAEPGSGAPCSCAPGLRCLFQDVNYSRPVRLQWGQGSFPGAACAVKQQRDQHAARAGALGP